MPVQPGYTLLVPKHDAELLTSMLANIPEETYPTWIKHKITRGESLSLIAKRYGTSVATLQDANNFYSNTIVAGKTLIVPPYKNSNKKPTNKAATKVQIAAAPVSIDAPYFYVVATGDSYWKIAARNNTTVERLAQINGRNLSQPLHPGESILVD